MLGKHKKRYRVRRRPPTFAMVFGLAVALIMTPLTVFAAPSWIRDGETSVYGGEEDASIDTGAEDVETKKETPDSLLKHMQKSFSFFTDANGEVFKDDNEQDLPYSISLEGLILGRLGGYKVSIGKFELYEGNPYGVIAAYGYRTIRNVLYSALFLYFLIKLIQQLFNNGARGRGELKEVIYTSIFIMAMVYFLPVFVNWFTVARDGVIGSLSREITGSKFPSFASAFDLVIEEGTTSAFAVVVLRMAYFFAGWFYLGSYVGIALQQMGLFILAPGALLLSFRDKKIFERWCSTFFANLIIPLLDYLFLLFPILIKTILARLGFTQNNGLANVAITVVAVWGVIPARNMVIAHFGSNAGGARGGAGLLTMGMMAMRMLARGGGSGSGGSAEGSGGLLSDLTNAERHQSNADLFEHALGERGRELQELDNLLSPSNEKLGISDLEEYTGLQASGVDEIASSLPVEDELPQAEMDIPAVSDSEAAAFEADGLEAASTNVDLAEDMGYVEQSAGYESGHIEGVNLPLLSETGDYPSVESGVEPVLSQSQRFEEMRYENLKKLDAAKDALRRDTELAARHDHAASVISSSVQDKNDRIAEINTLIGEPPKRSEGTITEISSGSPHAALYQERARLQQEVDAVMGRSTEVNRLREQGIYKGSATTDFAYHQEQAKAAHARVAANKTAIEKRTEVENRMGAMSALSGSSGKVYSTAEEYMDVRNQNDLIRRQANYRNFNSKAISEVLSAEEKAAFSRQRAVATGVKTVTKVATGAVGAAAMLAGGPSAMGAGAMAGAIVGDLVTNKADGTMEHRQQKEVRKAGPRFTDTDQDDEKRTDLKDVPLPVSPPTAKGTVNMDTLAEHARRGNERVNRHFSDSD